MDGVLETTKPTGSQNLGKAFFIPLCGTRKFEALQELRAF